MSKITRKEARQRRHRRVRGKVAGTAEVPRLCVFVSGRHIQVQVIDDVAGQTLAFATTQEKAFREANVHANMAGAVLIGKAAAERILAKSVTRVVFDRGGFRYHGRVKAIAEAAREAGLQF